MIGMLGHRYGRRGHYYDGPPLRFWDGSLKSWVCAFLLAAYVAVLCGLFFVGRPETRRAWGWVNVEVTRPQEAAP